MTRYFLRFLFLQFFFAHVFLPANTLIDLEKGVQDFVLETKQITIPGYPHAFNPSIVRWHGSLLLSFRVIPDPNSSFVCYIGFVWLDEKFNVISKPQLLDLRDAHSVSPSRAEDAPGGDVWE